jgi:3',5'-cyclic AMP phosphodiesterase CpdA
MAGVRLAHVSDLHLPFMPRLSPMQRLTKRQLSAWAWRRRSELHRPEILDALVKDIAAADVDHVVVTGDVVNFSLPGEFERAAAWMGRLAPAGALSVVPGNHDALVRVATAQGLALWDGWTRAEHGWPSLLRRGSLSIVGLNTAVPTLPLLARGRLGAGQLDRLEALLEREGAEGQTRVVLLHHPVANGVVGWRKALADRAALRAVLGRVGAELLLHGHARDARLDVVPGPREPIPCLCVPSSSALASRHDQGARWHRLVLPERGAADPRAEVGVRRWVATAGAFLPDITYEIALPRAASAAVARECATDS